MLKRYYLLGESILIYSLHFSYVYLWVRAFKVQQTHHFWFLWPNCCPHDTWGGKSCRLKYRPHHHTIILTCFGWLRNDCFILFSIQNHFLRALFLAFSYPGTLSSSTPGSSSSSSASIQMDSTKFEILVINSTSLSLLLSCWLLLVLATLGSQGKFGKVTVHSLFLSVPWTLWKAGTYTVVSDGDLSTGELLLPTAFIVTLFTVLIGLPLPVLAWLTLCSLSLLSTCAWTLWSNIQLKSLFTLSSPPNNSSKSFSGGAPGLCSLLVWPWPSCTGGLGALIPSSVLLLLSSSYSDSKSSKSDSFSLGWRSTPSAPVIWSSTTLESSAANSFCLGVIFYRLCQHVLTHLGLGKHYYSLH